MPLKCESNTSAAVLVDAGTATAGAIGSVVEGVATLDRARVLATMGNRLGGVSAAASVGRDYSSGEYVRGTVSLVLLGGAAGATILGFPGVALGFGVTSAVWGLGLVVTDSPINPLITICN